MLNIYSVKPQLHIYTWVYINTRDISVHYIDLEKQTRAQSGQKTEARYRSIVDEC